MRTTTIYITIIIPLLLNAELIFAQSSSSYIIPKLNGPVTLDGVVDEPAWEAIEPLPLVTHWPSFGEAVDTDDQQVNLTRFSLFFPERRQFFLERAAIFDFSFGGSDRLFHSRRIGLHQGQPVRILGD